MGKSNNSNSGFNALVGIIIFFSCFFLIASFVTMISNSSIEKKEADCAQKDMVYDKSKNSCREKTISERFEEKCTKGTTVDGITYTCSQLQAENLEEGFLNNKLIGHGQRLYTLGTATEVNAGKRAGDYCLSADETWGHIGENRCVVFYYSYIACSNGYCFLNEKQDYNNGFVAFFGKYRMYTWENFRATYHNNGPILVCGTIITYNGHPEIKITNVANQTLLNPNGTPDGMYTVYKYTCN